MLIAMVLLAIIASVAGLLQRYWQKPVNSNKYDLDYVLQDIPMNEYKEGERGLLIQGLLFPKGTYRILSLLSGKIVVFSCN